ncbi:clathrin coat assembly protein AP180-like [Humulus lupulus]|uniref:clathrin coat assembly protein AP180-like n=1 Tax=Humulus lupulus TaxID=3486 RepID=UPI002B404ECB|nr:clathrin coat assembly protein AP180-like [Humulus lupulus]
MPSKLRKALGVVKDQTSISLAKVSSGSKSKSKSNGIAINLEVPILKATSHHEIPLDETRYLKEILQVISTDKVYAAACAHAIAKRVGRTRNWIVALKSLMLVFRIFQHGDPHFPKEVFNAMKNGAKILNLSNFRDDSNSSPWDYTAFVRTFALYLDERLACFLSGKLHQCWDLSNGSSHGSRRGKVEPIRDMTPATLIDRISNWQKLLDRVIATKPTGDARTNRLVQSSLHAIVQESFDIYRDMSDGLALLLDSFFHLQYNSCVNAFQASVRASKQFEELSEFYGLCKSIGVGRTSEYPSVQKISGELIETLQEFLKDQASFPGRSLPSELLLAPPPATPDRNSLTGSESVSLCSSLDRDREPMSATNSDETEEDSFDDEDNQQSNTDSNNVSFDYTPKSPMEKDCWEHVLVSTAKENDQTTRDFDTFFDKRHYNPFLVDVETTDVVTVVSSPANNDINRSTHEVQNPEKTTPITPTFGEEEITSWVAPTFCAQNPNKSVSLFCNDPFESSEFELTTDLRNGSGNELNFVFEQQLWLEHQKKIIAKNELNN